MFFSLSLSLSFCLDDDVFEISITNEMQFRSNTSNSDQALKNLVLIDLEDLETTLTTESISINDSKHLASYQIHGNPEQCTCTG